MTNNLFPAQTDWTEAICFYVVATHHFRQAWLAGPYPTHEDALRALSAAQDWAVRSSQDQAAADYEYAVREHWNGHNRSILGEWAPPLTSGLTPFDDYEIAPCRRFEEPDAPGRFYHEPCDPKDADVWTLYGHLPGEGVEAIGDFGSREDAEATYARIAGKPYGR